MLRLEYLSNAELEAHWVTETKLGLTRKPYFVEFKALDTALIYIKIHNSGAKQKRFRVVETCPMSQLPVSRVVWDGNLVS